MNHETPRLWIGGAGRSGTSLIYRLLRAHPEVHAFRQEMRFLVDPGGLFDLVQSLSCAYSPARAREALDEFRELLLFTLDSPRTPPYPGFRFSEILGSDYTKLVDAYLSTLIWDTYRGRDVLTRTPLAKHLGERIGHRLIQANLLPASAQTWFSEMEKTQQRSVRYFSDRQELLNLTGKFVDELFSFPANNLGKKTWCEKTPHNLLFADFLQGLIPNSIFIHVYRDPRGVAQSYARQTWSSNDLRAACRTVRDIYERWLALRGDIDASRMIEVRLEEFAGLPLEQINSVLGRAGLSSFSEIPETVDSSKVDYWRSEASPGDRRVMNEELGSLLPRMGYEL